MQGLARRAAGRTWREHVFFGVPTATTFALGVWQVHRLGRKRNLIADRAARLASPPLTLSELSSATDVRDVEHRRVTLTGTFRHDAEMLVGPRSAPAALPAPVLQWAGPSGFLVVTPLDTVPPPGASAAGSPTTLVVRGWIPQRLADRPTRATAAVTPAQFGAGVPDDGGAEGAESDATPQRITGVVRRSTEERNRFTPDNSAPTGEWYYIDADAMAASTAPSSPAAPVVVELLEPTTTSGWPFVKPAEDHLTFRTPPSTHVVYAATWFSLAAALSVLTRARYRASAALRPRQP
jgi:surfeit locus 1 family protein